jgi:hypothetical protein
MTEKKVKASKPKTIDEYLAALSDDKRAALESAWTIRAAAPDSRTSVTSSPLAV